MGYLTFSYDCSILGAKLADAMVNLLMGKVVADRLVSAGNYLPSFYGGCQAKQMC